MKSTVFPKVKVWALIDLGEFFQSFNEDLLLILLRLFQKSKQTGIFPKKTPNFYEI